MNHTPLYGAVRLSDDDQSHLVSASPYLRRNKYISEETKNNTLLVENAVFGPIQMDAASPDNQLQYIRSIFLVKKGVWTKELRRQAKILPKSISRIFEGASKYQKYGRCEA